MRSATASPMYARALRGSMRARVERIFRKLEETGHEDVECVALMMGVDPHLDMSFFYATDLVHGGLFERSIAVLRKDGRVEVLTSVLEESSAKKASEIDLHVYTTNEEKEKWLADRLRAVAKVGINAPEITLNEYHLLKRLAPGRMAARAASCAASTVSYIPRCSSVPRPKTHVRVRSLA